MEVGNFVIGIKDDILIVTSKKNVVLDDLKDMHTLIENSTKKKYRFGIYRDLVGYYDGYDFEKQISVYCGVMNEKAAIEKIKKYIENETKNSSN